jgi:hypothetical protein
VQLSVSQTPSTRTRYGLARLARGRPERHAPVRDRLSVDWRGMGVDSCG